MQRLAEIRLKEANAICVDYRRPDEERRAAGMLFEAWSEIYNLRARYQKEYVEMKEAEGAQEALVGSKHSEQWYENRDE